MKVIELTERSDKDKVLHLSVPVDVPGQTYRVVIVVESASRESTPPIKEWPPDFFEKTAGQWVGPFERCQESFELLDNVVLEAAARSRMSPELAAELEELHLKQQCDGLNEAELSRCAELVSEYERAMLVRAHAATLLKKRGVDITNLLTQP